MKFFTTPVSDAEELNRFLARPPLKRAATSASAILVQLYFSQGEDAWLDVIVETLEASLPGALIVGASSAGEITNGESVREKATLAVTFFEASQLKLAGQPCGRGEEFRAGAAIGHAFADIANLRGILVLVPPSRLECTRILDGLHEALPAALVFGGGAANVGESASPCVLMGRCRSEYGVVAVALAGADLHLEQHVFQGWTPLGPRMQVTDAEGLTIRTIDDKPAIEAYRKYLQIEPGDEDIVLLEFPLLIERYGQQLARNPVAMNGDGSVSLVADVRRGESARLGYLDIDATQAMTATVLTQLQATAPEAILIFSCVCRRYALQQDIELEIKPFQSIAPVAGFFTYGEICTLPHGGNLLNSSQVLIAMREGEAIHDHAARLSPPLTEKDRLHLRHSRITARLFSMTRTLADELEAANRKLECLVKHDALTGALNRYALDENFESERYRAQRYGHQISLLILDIDYFKKLNDTHGHAVGDAVLQALTETAKASLRASDTFYRYGGEEFLILLPETGAQAALKVGEKIRARLASLAEQRTDNLPAITCSIGVATYPTDGLDMSTIIKVADAALYRAKTRGRNRVVGARDV